ncbi:MAG: YidC/Oxa1 family membrane protein insertase [Chloroflexi bacterium]|nr:YidC/Oxa1 family membrane protein insertase [Chloroflexota bacterium]
MEALTSLWNSLLVWPIEGALLYLTQSLGNAGIAIIVFTIAVRTLMLPLTMKQVQSQRAMMLLQPRLKELQRRHSGDRQRIAQEQMRLYKEAGVNPVAGCLPLVLQMPIWIALYSALNNLTSHTESFQGSFLWIANLAQSSTPNWPDVLTEPSTLSLLILPVLAAGTQWMVQKMSTMPTVDPQQQQMNRMMEFMPIMFLVFSLQVGAGLALYWVVSNVYTIVQQRVLVGWGSLPFFGSSLPATGGSAQETNGTKNEPSEGPRRIGPTPPPRRRRRGK